MKIILQKPVEKLGDPGDVLDVADGYARNFLVPRGLADQGPQGRREAGGHPATCPLRRRCPSRRPSSRPSPRSSSQAVRSRVAARAGEEGKLFGSVTAADLAEAIAAQMGIPVDRKDVHLEDPIKSVGTHEVRVHLFAEVDPVAHRRGRGRGLTNSQPARRAGPGARPLCVLGVPFGRTSTGRFRVNVTRVIHNCPHGCPHGESALVRARSDKKSSGRDLGWGNPQQFSHGFAGCAGVASARRASGAMGGGGTRGAHR